MSNINWEWILKVNLKKNIRKFHRWKYNNQSIKKILKN